MTAKRTVVVPDELGRIGMTIAADILEDEADRPPCWLGGILALAILVLCIGGFAMLVWG